MLCLKAVEDIIARLHYPMFIRIRLDFDMCRFRRRRDAVDVIWQWRSLWPGLGPGGGGTIWGGRYQLPPLDPL
jgi:hypothetical protein